MDNIWKPARVDGAIGVNLFDVRAPTQNKFQDHFRISEQLRALGERIKVLTVQCLNELASFTLLEFQEQKSNAEATEARRETFVALKVK